MIVLTIDNSYSLVTGLTDLEFRGLRKILSYSLPYNPASKWSRGPQVRYLIDKRGSFASGLLSRVLKYFKDCNLQYQFTDLRIMPNAQEGMFVLDLGYGPIPPSKNPRKGPL